jgi:hypothetical protein
MEVETRVCVHKIPVQHVLLEFLDGDIWNQRRFVLRYLLVEEHQSTLSVSDSGVQIPLQGLEAEDKKTSDQRLAKVLLAVFYGFSHSLQ